jgi:UDP-N-acetylglucosamine--N-acetylmuramyl-(pentapeptide) pyrophosphoryl-undecaprenol N-acetylglucosamine transferase
MEGHKIIIAGGGTGGHVFPAIAIGRALERLEPSVQLLFVGALGKMEMEKVPEAGFRVKGLEIAGLNRSAWWKNISLPVKVIRSLRQAREIIRDFSPDVVVGVGGYASFPMLRSAQNKGIPTLIQEQNSYAGKTNKLMGKKAGKICVAYDGMEKFFPREKLVLTGNPVRHDIAENSVTREAASAAFGLDPGKKTVLAVGGSLGAKSINEAIYAHLDEFTRSGIQLIWQTGTLFIDQATEIIALKEASASIRAQAFIRHMDKAYAAADVIISRAGSTIAELCIVGKPAILVPYPYAAEDHQTQNARSLVDKNAALMVKDSDTGNELIDKAIGLIADEALQRQLTDRLKGLAIKDSDERIAKEILKLA